MKSYDTTPTYPASGAGALRIGSQPYADALRARRASAVERAKPLDVQPFVLRCPECGGPQTFGSAQCRFCNVALTWHSQIAPDDFDDGVGQWSNPHVPGDLCIGIDRTAVYPDTQVVLTTRLLALFRLTSIFVPPTVASCFTLDSLKVGMLEQLTQGPIPCEAFTQPFPMKCDTGMPGTLISLAVTNISAQATASRMVASFSALLRGRGDR